MTYSPSQQELPHPPLPALFPHTFSHIHLSTSALPPVPLMGNAPPARAILHAIAFIMDSTPLAQPLTSQLSLLTSGVTSFGKPFVAP